MSIKEFLKPTILKISIFLFIGISYLYFAGEDVCAVGLLFKFCYKAFGFPLMYIISGDINNASDYINTLPLGQYFHKSGNYLFNYISLALDIVLIYLLACFVSMLFKHQNSTILKNGGLVN